MGTHVGMEGLQFTMGDNALAVRQSARLRRIRQALADNKRSWGCPVVTCFQAYGDSGYSYP